MTCARLCAIALGVLLHASLLPAREQRLVVHYTPRDQELQRYAYVPVDVPPGVTTLTIGYSYDAREGANAVDLGVFEPGPLTPGSPAFRGWSGGSRDRVTIGVAEATPGYWPGALPAGTWHVVLGLYKVAATGVDVALTVTYGSVPGGTAPAIPARRTTPLRRGPAWYAGIVHAHTTESDGALTPPQLIAKAQGEALDFIAITDHNNTTHQLFPLDRPDLLVLTGEEVTTPGGHFSVWGLGGARDYVDFRLPAGDASLSALMDAVHRRGGVIAINHPVTDCLACSWTHAIPPAVDAIESANGAAAGRLQSMAIWDTLLRSGRRVTAVEGRDWHRGDDALGAPALRVWAPDLSVGAILDGIRAGRAVVVANAALPAPELQIESGGRTARIGDTLHVTRGQSMRVSVSAAATPYRGARVEWVWNGEALASLPLDDAGVVRVERVPPASGYGRVHIVAADGRPLAVTNPVFIAVR
jgi:hypothetical protein